MKKLVIMGLFAFIMFLTPAVQANTELYELEETLEAEDRVRAVAFSPDSNYIAYGGNDERVHIHDTDTFAHQETITHSFADTVWTVDYSPDGSYIAFGSSNDNVYIHDTDTYDRQGLLLEAESGIQAVAFSPDSNYIAYGGIDDNVYIHDTTDDYNLQETLTEAEASVRGIAFSPDGSHIAYGSSDENVYIHDTDTYTLQETLTEAEDTARSVAFSPDGSHIAYGGLDNNVYIHDTDTYTLQETLTEAVGTVWSLDYSHDGSHIAYSGSSDVYIHDTDTYAHQETITSSESWVHSLAYSPDGNYIATGSRNDECVYIHDADITSAVKFEDYDGTLLDEQTVNHGDDAVPPADPWREGYTFEGWDGEYTNITGDTTITATYEKVRTVQEVINDWLDDVGLGGPFGSMFIAVAIMSGVSFIATIYHAPLPVLVLINLILLLLAVLLGFVPAWVSVGLAVAIMSMIYIVLTDIPIGGGDK